MGDVTDEAEVGRMAGEAAAAFGRIDILVNNAAIRRQVPFTEMSYGEWRESMAVILDGAFLMCRAVLPVMVAGGGGTFVPIRGFSPHIAATPRAHVSAARPATVRRHTALA